MARYYLIYVNMKTSNFIYHHFTNLKILMSILMVNIFLEGLSKLFKTYFQYNLFI